MRKRVIFFCALLLAVVFSQLADDDYQIGTAIYDVTGPAAEAGMMGYAMINQRTKGIHFRLHTRTFILKHKRTQTSVVYINLDLCMTMLAVRQQVLEDLRLYHPNLYKLYNATNIIISSTHTHAGPGGYSWYTLYDVTTFGWDKKHFLTITSGIVESIRLAHENLSAGGRIKINQGFLFNSNINRSPNAYLANPEEERKQYATEGDTDKLMTVLRLEDDKQKELGAIVWFSVHCTSMNNANLLISGDNKGYASYAFEKYKNGDTILPGKGPFVAAFCNTNEGDSSPNTKGAHCPDGKPCDPDSTCGGKVKLCVATGPGKDEFESTQIIGTYQMKKALELYESATQVVSGTIETRHTYLRMPNITVNADYTSTGKQEHTCRAAMGYSFAAGTTDGPGEFDFHQGMNKSGNPFWDFVKNFIKKPTAEQIKCHKPKPVLLDVGEIEPYPWTPDVLPIHLITIGKYLVISGVPAEFSTMSGRRLRSRVKKTLISFQKATNQTAIVVSGLSNAYSGYVATYEEYNIQRYEGASTLFGPHTLSAYIQEFDKLAEAIGRGIAAPPGPTPVNLTERQHTFNPGVLFDSHPIGKPFGTVHVDALPRYTRGQMVQVQFWGAHPKNDFMIQKSFFNVEQQMANGSWRVIRTDGDWDTKFHWKRYFIAESIITCEWNIEDEVPAGTYRFKTYGHSKSILGQITPYEGTSSSFVVE